MNSDPTRPRFSPLLAIAIPAVLAMVYFFPRFLVEQLGEASPWTCYLYQYGFGFVFFISGIFMILKTKACQFGRGRDSFWFGVLIAGFLFFSVGHAVWIYLALNAPYLGAP